MPISAPSQIGLDILRSPALPGIEPARAERLDRSSATAGQFSVSETCNTKAAGAADKPATPASFKRFEAMVLQTFIQNMLPKDGAAFYGKGMAGDMWKSLLAEKVAEVMADRGGIGIADRVLGDRYAAEARPVAQTAAPAQSATADDRREPGSQSLIAPAVLDGMQRSLTGMLTDDPAASPQTEVQSTTKRG